MPSLSKGWPIADCRLPMAKQIENRKSKIESGQGAVLLEVLVAVALFSAAAAVIGGALSASIASLDRLRAQLHAEDLAVSVLSQVQLGLIPLTAAGPEPFDPPFGQWNWEVQVSMAGEMASGDGDRQVEVTVRQLDGPVVRRLVQWVAVPPASQEEGP